MDDLDDWHIQQLTRPQFGDLFNYVQRAAKRLIRRTLALSDHIGANERVANDAITLEAWIVCIVPVMQGYWRSRVAEERRSQVLDRYSFLMLNFVVNDLVMQSSAFREMKTDDQMELMERTLTQVRETLRQRADEYIPAIANFFVRKNVEKNALPKELTALLIRNLFANQNTNGADELSATKGLPDLDIMTRVALPVIGAYVQNLNG